MNEISVSFHWLSSYRNDLYRNDFLTKRPVSIKITIPALIFYLLFYQYSALKVAHTGQSVEEAVENVVAAVSEIARIVPRGWNNIQSLNLKTTDSISLPIYTSLPEKSLALETSEPPKKKKKKAWSSIFSSSFYIFYLQEDQGWNVWLCCLRGWPALEPSNSLPVNGWNSLQSATFCIKIIKLRNDQPNCCTCSVEEVGNLSLGQNRTLRSLTEFEHWHADMQYRSVLFISDLFLIISIS